MKRKFTMFSKLFILLISFSTLVHAQITELYLVGDAVPTGWNISNPTAMTLNGDVFEWSGALHAGSIKISTFKGDWCDGQWLNASEASQPIANAAYIITEGCEGPDNQWVVSEEAVGTYKVSVDLTAETIVFELLSTEIADISLSGLTASAGDLTPDFDPSVTNFFLTVPAGTQSVEITATTTDAEATVTGDGLIDLTEGDTTIAILVTGSDGINQFTYSVSITLVEEGEIYTAMYLVGDATPSGWDIATPVAMTQDSENPAIFEWEGKLTAGEMKFSTFTGDWCDGDWLLAETADQILSIGNYTIYTGCPPGEEDFKWRVAEADTGTYIITIDLENETIVFDLQETVGLQVSDFSSVSVYPNPAHSYFTIDLGPQDQGTAEIYAVDGRTLYQTKLMESQTMVDVNEIASPGLVILKISTEEAIQTVRLVLQ